MYQLKQVPSEASWSDFVQVPWNLYGNDPNWAPPLRVAVRDTLNEKKNPFFKHSDFVAHVAYEDGRPVGRILGTVDHVHNKFHKEKIVFFGFFESKEDPKLSALLLNQVKTWGQSKGMSVLRGPMNPSTNYECGLLVEGFDAPSFVMMTYNPSYYPGLLENFGLKKVKDLLAWEITQEQSISERMAKHIQRVKKRYGITVRTLVMSKLKSEIELIQRIYEEAWESNWGFVPLDKEELSYIAKDMKLIVDPRMVLIAEVNGEPAAWALALPDINQALIKNRSGKLLPFNFLKLIWNLKGPGRKKIINRARIVTLGVRSKYRHLGLGPLLYSEYLVKGPAIGYLSAECSWILEDNTQMNSALEQMGARKTKVYRIYDAPLS